MPKLTRDESAAIFAYLARGGAIRVYAPNARALPPSYRDDSPRPPRIYCINLPIAVYHASSNVYPDDCGALIPTEL